MPIGMSCDVKPFTSRIETLRGRIEQALIQATAESIHLVQEAAQRILEKEVYDHPRGDFAEPLTWELYNAWVQDIAVAGMECIGELANTSDHAIFLELGTDDEGTGTHKIFAGANGMLHWINPVTGQEMFRQSVLVHGIKPLHFLERALTENTAKITTIYKKYINAALTG